MAAPYPMVEVAVVLIGQDGRLALDYNPNWARFCLPMTKLRDLPPEVPGGAGRRESPSEAAVRAAVEVLGRPLGPTELPQTLAVDVPPYQQSGRDGQWKRYRFHVFGLKAGSALCPLPGHTAVWRTPAEIRSERPVSPTSLHVLAAVADTTLLALLV